MVSERDFITNNVNALAGKVRPHGGPHFPTYIILTRVIGKSPERVKIEVKVSKKDEFNIKSHNSYQFWLFWSDW